MFALYVILLAIKMSCICAWNSQQMEVFDLVEEMNNINFYQFLGVTEDANSSTIRQAFRKMSLVLHPDKNNAPDAEARFRELVSVHDVLRNPVKRGHYDKVLKEGLPDWHHAVYYYRRARRMGFIEMIVILFSIISIGQYLVAWGSYIENKFTVDELLSSKIKKLKKQKKYRGSDSTLPPEFDVNLPKPSLKNTLPCQIPYWLWIFVLKSPSFTVSASSFLIEKFKNRKSNQNKVDYEKPEPIIRERIRRRKTPYKLPEVNDYTNSNGPSEDSTGKINTEKNDTPTIVGSLWTDEDLFELSQLVNKFPPGTSDRWQKVSKAMLRPVSEVTYMANKIKQNGYKVPNETYDTVIAEEPKKIKTRAIENQVNDSWTQIQQKALENALVNIPKGCTENRWEKISKCVPNKSKEECISRYKQLNEELKKKKNLNDENIENHK